MITRVYRGWQIGGLIVYLMGPGRAEEHVRPRVIAHWDGRDVAKLPPAITAQESEQDLGPLIRALRAPVVAGGFPEQPTSDGRQGHVWHCSARLADADRVLTDAEWAEIARELLHGAGVVQRDDPGGPRWVAVRHADDHIHIAAVLIRQDTGRRFWPYRDYPRLRATAQEIEQRLGLTLTASADGTAERASARGEIEKSARLRRDPARPELVRAIRRAAVAAHNVVSFRAALIDAGFLVEIRRAPSGDPLGYKIARPGDVTAAGTPVFYSGSKLAGDLSLPKLQRRWAQAGAASRSPKDPLLAAPSIINAARGRFVDADTGAGADIASATSDVVVAVAALAGPDVRLTDAAASFDRAVRLRGASSAGEQGRALRRIARRLVSRRGPMGQDEAAATVTLVVALVALIREVARWQQAGDHRTRAVAAQRAADVLMAWSRDPGPTTTERPPLVSARERLATSRPRRGQPVPGASRRPRG